MTAVTRHDPAAHPDHGRPCILELKGKAGKLAVHVSRDDRSLWLFATGPSGGDRGRVCLATRLAPQLAEWLAGGCEGSFVLGGGSSNFMVGADVVSVWRITARYNRASWEMPLEPDVRAVLVEALHGWANAAVASA